MALNMYDFATPTLNTQNALLQGKSQGMYSNAMRTAAEGGQPNMQGLAPDQIAGIQQMVGQVDARERQQMQDRYNILSGAVSSITDQDSFYRVSNAIKQQFPDLNIPSSYTQYLHQLPQIQSELQAIGSVFAQPEEAYTLSPGQQRMVGDQVVAENNNQTPEDVLAYEMAQQRLSDMRRDAAQEEQAAIDAQQQQVTARNTQVNQIESILGEISAAYNEATDWATGKSGALMGIVPGSDAYNLRRRIGTIQANLGFDKLQQMRDASPTGGALGQVSERELDFLQSTLTALDPNMGEDRLRAALVKAKNHYENWLLTLQGINPDSVSPSPQQRQDTGDGMATNPNTNAGVLFEGGTANWADLPD